MDRSMVRQGDVLLIPVSQIPNGATVVKTTAGRVVLAEGESTGHAHTLEAGSATLYSTADSADRWLRVHGQSGGGVAVLTHQEHASIELPPGDYIMRRQREYTPEEIRRVAD